jgi:glycine/D-amino acid oxidase-like deaminating enzyme
MTSIIDVHHAKFNGESPTVEVQRFLDELLAARCMRAKVARRWAGLVGQSCDELPNVGFLPGAVNLFVCGGYSGIGLGLAAVLTRMAADLIARGASELPFRMFDPRRHT